MTEQDNDRRTGRRQAGRDGRSRKQRIKPLAGYRRVSSKGERRDDEFRSPDFQLATLDRWGEATGHAIQHFECEVDVSGSRSSRPILDAIVERIEAGELGGIVVAKLNRLSRLKPLDRIALVERIEAAGGVVLSASESLDASTPEGRLTRELFFGIARMEYERYAEGWITAKEEAIKAGVPVKAKSRGGRRINYGYEVGAERRLVPVDGERELVVELFERRAVGASRPELVELFEQRTGQPCYPQMIRRMLRNRVYLGELSYGELHNPSAHEAIVEVELFEAVQKVERARSWGPGSGRRPRALLAGIARCEGCGRGLTTSSKGGRQAAAYACPSKASECPARASIVEAELDRYVDEQVVEWIGPLADELVELEVELNAQTPRIVLEHRLADARRVLVEYEQDVERELRIGREAYQAGTAARVQLVEQRERELDEHEDEGEIAVASSTLRRAIEGDELDVDERRRLLRIILDGVVVRRTPRRGAPASERARLVFAAAADVREQDREQLVA